MLIRSTILATLLACLCSGFDHLKEEIEESFVMSIGGNVTSNGIYIPQKALENLMKKLKIGSHHHDHHDHHHHDDDLVHHVKDEKSIYHEEIPCINSTELIQLYNLSWNEDTFESIQALCPALLQQHITGACMHSHEKKKPTNLAVWGWSTLAMALLAGTSLVGIALLPLLKHNIYNYVMLLLVGTGVGTLFGDAILHLVPEILGVHSHDNAGLPDYFGFLLILSAFVFIFHLLSLASEFLFHGAHPQENEIDHGHSHIPDLSQVKKITHKESRISPASMEVEVDGKEIHQLKNIESADELPKCSPITETDEQNRVKIRSSVSYLLLICDVAHNLADGLAIGVAFSSDISGGVRTAIAIFFHELPHEFADFAILTSAGFSVKKALLANFLCASTGFIGMYVGIAITTVSSSVRKWIFGATAGMFLYLSLVEMLPTIKIPKTPSRVYGILVANVGILSGFCIMLLLSYLEPILHNVHL